MLPRCLWGRLRHGGELVGIGVRHALEHTQRRLRLVLVDAGQGEADMDKDPVPRPGWLLGEQRYVDPAPGPADVDPGVLRRQRCRARL